MAMHIAVVADNIAHRKQLERLLDRANDTLRDQTGMLYIDAYGDKESLLKTPMKYNLVFIDITLEEAHGRDIIAALHDLGSKAQIVICVPEGTPFSYDDTIHKIHTIEKPIFVAALHRLLLDIYQIVQETSKPLIEIRSTEGTHFVATDDLVYAEEQNHLVYVHTDGKETLAMLGVIEDFYRWVEPYPEFIRLTKHVVINENHVVSKSRKGYLMTNGDMVVGRKPLLPF